MLFESREATFELLQRLKEGIQPVFDARQLLGLADQEGVEVRVAEILFHLPFRTLEPSDVSKIFLPRWKPGQGVNFHFQE